MQMFGTVFVQSDHKAREHRPRQHGVDKEEDRQDYMQGIDLSTSRRTTFHIRRIPKLQGVYRQGNKQEDRHYIRQGDQEEDRQDNKQRIDQIPRREIDTTTRRWDKTAGLSAALGLEL